MSPRIYVADLAAYNEGELHGVWLDATDDDLAEQAQAMLKPGHEEWAIHDYEGFGELRIDEYESLDNVHTLAMLIDEHGDAFAAYVDHVGGIEYATAESFEDAHCGEWESEEEYAEQLAVDTAPTTELHEWLRGDAPWPFNCIDWEQAARDLFMGNYWSADAGSGRVYVFRSY